jgi:hypothetical protein
MRRDGTGRPILPPHETRTEISENRWLSDTAAVDREGLAY